MIDIIHYIDAVLASLFASVASGQKRFFWGYLLAAVVVALIWQAWRLGLSWKEGLRRSFSRAVWLHPSSRADGWLCLLNRAVAVAFAPVLLTQLAVATLVFESLHQFSLPLPSWQLPWSPTAVALAFTVVLFLLDDASRYALHRALHRVPFLWAFHRVHHSAEVLTPLTVFRTHPLENVLFGLRAALVQGVCVGGFFFVFGDKVSLLSVMGANVFLFVFNATFANLRHSHLPIAFPAAWERWLISPKQHQIHHSCDRAHYDKNFGVVLAVWDRWAGSLYLSEQARRRLRFGEKTARGQGAHTLLRLYVQPFVQAFRLRGLKAKKPLQRCLLFRRAPD